MKNETRTLVNIPGLSQPIVISLEKSSKDDISVEAHSNEDNIDITKFEGYKRMATEILKVRNFLFKVLVQLRKKCPPEMLTEKNLKLNVNINKWFHPDRIKRVANSEYIYFHAGHVNILAPIDRIEKTDLKFVDKFWHTFSDILKNSPLQFRNYLIDMEMSTKNIIYILKKKPDYELGHNNCTIENDDHNLFLEYTRFESLK